MEYGFYRYDLQIYYGLLWKEDLPVTQQTLERDFLGYHYER